MANYKTIQGETWDQVAKKVYGREVLFHHLVAANPAHKDTLIFSSGVELVVPFIEPQRVVEVPRWKQG